MLRLTVSPEEYLMINDNIKIVFLGGTKNHLRIMIDAPKEKHRAKHGIREPDHRSGGESEASQILCGRGAPGEIPQKI